MQKECKLLRINIILQREQWGIFLPSAVRTNEVCFLTDSYRFQRGVAPIVFKT